MNIVIGNCAGQGLKTNQFVTHEGLWTSADVLCLPKLRSDSSGFLSVVCFTSPTKPSNSGLRTMLSTVTSFLVYSLSDGGDLDSLEPLLAVLREVDYFIAGLTNS